MDSFLNWFMSTIGQHMSKEFAVFVVSMLPLIEERGGLILARLLKLPLYKALILCILGNIAPIPLILFYIKKLLKCMASHNMNGLVAKFEQKAEKNKEKIDRYGFWGLALFVGIPLPGTGAWSGSLVAALFDMDLKRASISILIGIFMAAMIMTFLSYGLFGGMII